MTDMVAKAAKFAAEKHSGQFRKYPDVFGLTEPYIMHPARVAGMVVANHSLFPAYVFESAIAAAWLHDVMEDCGINVDMISNEFSPYVGVLVTELTNTSKLLLPRGTRKERKTADLERIKGVGREVKIIKMFDRIDNLSSMFNAPEDFAMLYLKESEELAEALRDADRATFNALAFTINAVRKNFEARI